MRKSTLTLISSLVFGFSFAQSYNQQLLKVYQVEKLNAIQENNPEKILDLNYAVENACYFTQISGKSLDGISSITLSNTNKAPKFTDLGLKITNSNQYFKITGSDKILVIKSEIVINNERKNKNIIK